MKTLTLKGNLYNVENGVLNIHEKIKSTNYTARRSVYITLSSMKHNY